MVSLPRFDIGILRKGVPRKAWRTSSDAQGSIRTAHPGPTRRSGTRLCGNPAPPAREFSGPVSFRRAGVAAWPDPAWHRSAAQVAEAGAAPALGASRPGQCPAAIAAISRKPFLSYDKALALKPDQADVYNNRGIALAGLQQFDEALASYGRAIALKPDYAQAFNNRGTVLSGCGRTAEAMADFSQAIALDPGYVRAFINRASLLASLGRYEDALKDYDRAIVLDPRDVDSHGKRGNLLIGLRRAQEALESFDRAIALDPGLSSAHDGRGTALAMLGRHQDALAAHDKAIALDPDFATAHTNRGAALASLQRMAASLEAHDRALALDPQIRRGTQQSRHCAGIAGTAGGRLGEPGARPCDPAGSDPGACQSRRFPHRSQAL